MAATERSLVRGKLEPPKAGGPERSRPRVDALIADLLEHSRVLTVTATAGSGKSAAVTDALAAASKHVAWLTLDRYDVSPGRLLSYLEASLRVADPTIDTAATNALADGVAHPEAAGLLAESLGGSDLTIVIDELERIADAPLALEALDGFIRYLPDHARVIVIGRQEVPLDLARLRLAGEVAHLGESDLALTIDEAGRLLGSLGHDDADAAQAVEATAGWLTGVLFDSWRSSQHVFGTGGETDPLRRYLASEIMAALPAEAQDFLVRTSVLDEVTAARAEALGISGSAAILALLRERHLPVEFPEPHRMRCHPRVREYLLEQLEDREPGIVRSIRSAHADLLVAEGRDEEAIDEYLRAGQVAQAEDTAEAVVLPVVRRLDVDLVARWLGAFRRKRIESSVDMTAAGLLVALEREQYAEGALRADQLRTLTEQHPEHRLDAGLSGAMAWCYFLMARIEDAQLVLSDAAPGPQTETMSFAIGVELVDSFVHYRDRPQDSDTEVDGMLARIDLAHGRFERVLGARTTRYTAVRGAQLGALTGLGRLEEAQEQLARLTTGPGWTQVRMRAELLAELDRAEEAWSTLIRGREMLAQTGSPLYRMFASLTEAMLALRFSHDTALASAILDAVHQEPTALRRVRVLEQLSLWRGLCALLDGDDAVAARHLREAVELMTEWDRLLFLPTATVYLAEAEWRLHQDTASDAAADLALQTADRTGSRHALIHALREFPAVLSRRLDAETDPDSAWHDLGRAVIASSGGAHRVGGVRVVEFGEPAVIVEGKRYRLKLTKSIELLAFLAWRGGSAPREDIISSLFDSKSNQAAGAYLRMALNGVREIFPEPGCIEVDADTVRWTLGDLESDFTAMHTRLLRLRNVQGAQRLALATAALADLPGGEYLPGSRSDWANDQRRRWNDLDLDLHHAAAEAAFEVADYGNSHLLIETVIARDPFRERAWRLEMRIAGAVGDGDGVIAAYRGCERALDALGITPTDSTRQLLQRLRF